MLLKSFIQQRRVARSWGETQRAWELYELHSGTDPLDKRLHGSNGLAAEYARDLIKQGHIEFALQTVPVEYMNDETLSCLAIEQFRQNESGTAQASMDRIREEKFKIDTFLG